MTTSAFPITVASLKSLACALSIRLDPAYEMRVLIRFCAAVLYLEPLRSMESLHDELCAAILARNRLCALRNGLVAHRIMAKPSYGEFCRRLKTELASTPDPFVSEAIIIEGTRV